MSTDILAVTEDAGGVVRIDVTGISGSAPREQGAWMLVSKQATWGTIGGGHLEHRAIAQAQALLATPHQAKDRMKVVLGLDTGQCCGGVVDLTFTRLCQQQIDLCRCDAERQLADQPVVYIFGAGHVGQALARALGFLPVRPVLVDGRQAALDAALPGVETILSAIPETVVHDAAPGSAFVVMTHDHGLDFLIVRDILARGDAAYAGLIGSQTKRAALAGWLRRETGSDAGMNQLICPIGEAGVGDKRPEIIAALTAAEILAHLFGGGQ